MIIDAHFIAGTRLAEQVARSRKPALQPQASKDSRHANATESR
jgi:hypothetical protein